MCPETEQREGFDVCRETGAEQPLTFRQLHETWGSPERSQLFFLSVG